MYSFLSLLFYFVMMLSLTAQAQQDITGRWKTIDDRTGKPRSVVTIYQTDNGKIEGKVTTIYPQPGDPANPICEECEGENKNKPVKGMVIIKDLDWDDDAWQDGTILDPESGSVYKCKIWREEGKLKVRGYIGFLYRTQTWEPM